VARVTLQTIADRVGVSRMTVSNAFSRPDQLSEELRARVLAVADDLGYVGPDPAARALARGATGAVGLLLTESVSEAFTDQVATDFLAAVADALGSAGLSLTLLTPGRGRPVIPSRDVAMDGVLVYVCDPDNADVKWLRRRRLPMVGVDQEPLPGTPHINVDDRGGARAAAQHVLDLGHRRIGVLNLGVGTPHGLVDHALAHPNAFTPTQRMLGWTDALDAAGVIPSVALVPFHPPEAAYDGARLLLTQPTPPTAVLCFSDVFAASAVRAAGDLGLRVPADLSVVGFDDNRLAARTDPPLTTVRQDVAAKGRAAVAALTAALKAHQDGSDRPVEHITLPAELVVRASTAPPAPDALSRSDPL